MLMITEMITEIGHRTVIVTTCVMCDHTSGGGAAAGGRLSSAEQRRTLGAREISTPGHAPHSGTRAAHRGIVITSLQSPSPGTVQELGSSGDYGYVLTICWVVNLTPK